MGEEGGRAAEQVPGSDLNQQLRCVEDQQAQVRQGRRRRGRRGGGSAVRWRTRRVMEELWLHRGNTGSHAMMMQLVEGLVMRRTPWCVSVGWVGGAGPGGREGGRPDGGWREPRPRLLQEVQRQAVVVKEHEAAIHTGEGRGGRREDGQACCTAPSCQRAYGSD